MPLAPDPPFPKTQGDNIRSKDWNDLVGEVQRLDTAKLNRNGDTAGTLSVSDLVVDPSNANDGALKSGLSFGSRDQEGIASKRTAGGNQNGLDLYTKGAARLSITEGGNVGIGTQAPGLVLDVADRIRLRQGPNGTAGHWLFQTGPNNDRAFIGMAGDSLVGLWGNTGAGWGLAMDTTNGNVGIGTLSPGFKLDVANRIRLRQGSSGTAGLWLFQTGPNGDRAFVGMLDDNQVGLWGSGSGWGLFMDTNTARVTCNGDFAVARGKGNELAYMGGDGFGGDVQFGSLNAGVSGLALYNAAGNFYMNLFANQLHGTKVGYVVDQFVNNLGEALEVGDVVVIGRNQTSLYYGPDDTIPIPEVDTTETAYDTRVCGIVCEAYGDLVPETDERLRTTAGAIPKKKTGRKKGTKAVPLRPRKFTTEEAAELDRTRVEPGQVGLLATLGAYAHCKVDAGIAPVDIGDLLTTSPTKGHAQRVEEPAKAVGAIIGKALGSLEKGRGQVPVLVMLQ